MTFLTAVKCQVNKFDSCHLSQIPPSLLRHHLEQYCCFQQIFVQFERLLIESCLFSERWTSPRARTTEERKPDVAEQIVEIRGRLNNTESLTDTILLPNEMLSEYSSKKTSGNRPILENYYHFSVFLPLSDPTKCSKKLNTNQTFRAFCVVISFYVSKE